MAVINYYRQNLKDMPELDPTIDLNRRQRRAAEFTIRFARNYLYQIGRIVFKILLRSLEKLLNYLIF